MLVTPYSRLVPSHGFLKGLAYVDFIDEDHLAAAVAKNKHMLLGKRLSIARSNPKQKKESNASIAPGENG